MSIASRSGKGWASRSRRNGRPACEPRSLAVAVDDPRDAAQPPVVAGLENGDQLLQRLLTLTHHHHVGSRGQVLRGVAGRIGAADDHTRTGRAARRDHPHGLAARQHVAVDPDDRRPLARHRRLEGRRLAEGGVEDRRLEPACLEVEEM